MPNQSIGKKNINGKYYEKHYSEPEPFDWYQRYQGLRDCLTQNIKLGDKILDIGCGTSRMTFSRARDD